MDNFDTVREFLIECDENLAKLDQAIVALERDPANGDLLASIFRTIHTMKGAAGILGLSKLTSLTHAAESLLAPLRDGKRRATSQLIGVILEAVDGVKELLESIAKTGGEGEHEFPELTARLLALAEADNTPAAAPPLPITLAEPVHPSATLSDLPEASELSKTGAALEASVRVDVSLLDKLMNLVGELVLARNQVLQFSSRLESSELSATSQRLNLITSELQASVMKTRMQPIGNVWSKFPRVVRDLAVSCGKYIQLKTEGAGTELDRTIIEAIKDPLMHIVRNSCDHGIERPEERLKRGKTATGRLTLRAFHEGGHVNIEILDDGAGVNPEKLKEKAQQQGLLSTEQAAKMTNREAVNLIFLPGFSTAEKVSSISGRGVGMDVVKSNIERIGGVVDLLSVPGQGTTIKIKIPLTLAIIPGLVVISAGERFVIPQVSLLELIRLEGDGGIKHIERIHDAPVYRLRGKLLPLTFLHEILKMPAPQAASGLENIVVLQAEESQFGLVVDSIHDTQEIVVKPLGKRLKGLSVYSGATIMGDGKVALILDVLGLAQRSGVLRQSGDSKALAAKAEPSTNERQTLLLFSAAHFERLAVPLSLVARLEEIPGSRIEQAAGQMVVQYRGQILPLVSLAEQLAGGPASTVRPDQTVPVVVFSNRGALIGLMVDRILDIVEGSVSVPKAARKVGLLGSAVVGQQVTDFIDLPEIMARAGEAWLAGQSETPEPTTVLVAEHSPFARGQLRVSLEMAGYCVLEAGGFQEAVDHLAGGGVQLVAASLAFANLARHMKNDPKLAHIPLLGLLLDGAEAPAGLPAELFADTQVMFDRKAMLTSLDRLAAAIEPGSQPKMVATR